MKDTNSRQTILACALQLFAARGYDAVSISDIVEQAGVTKPTLYYFFGSKEGLFEELLRVNYEKLDGQLADACRYDAHPQQYHADVFPLLLHAIGAFFSFAQSHTAFYLMVLSLTFAPALSRPAQMAEPYHKTHYQILERMFCEVAAVHPNLAGKERISSWRFLAMINAQIGFWQRGYGLLDEATAQSIASGFMHGVFS